MDNDIVNTFCDLVKIPSPTGNEKNVATFIRNYLKKMDIASYADDAGKKSNSNTGNIIAKIGKGIPKIMFAAHMDTVEDGKRRVNPIIKNGVIRSDGTTILGADDKAGVAALLSAAKDLKEEQIPAFLCVFTIGEEHGLMGAKNVGIKVKPKFAFDIDGLGRIGTFTNKALGYVYFEIRIYGKEAHSAANPERGRNAIKAAGYIISKLKLGMHGKDNFLNLGTISGGSKDNVIPGYCLITALARAYDYSRLQKNLKKYEAVVKEACAVTGCTYKMVRGNSEKPLDEHKKSKIVNFARRACRKAGFPFKLQTARFTVQANALATKGYPVLSMSRGGKMPHAKSESIKIRELHETKRLIMALVKQAAA